VQLHQQKGMISLSPPTICNSALNIIVLWNTIYMDAAIQHLRREEYPVLDSDVEKLSPLQCGHINMQGRYSFIVPESVSKGELRAFNEDV
ncbi:Tn3 family transposase, partial [Escherichia coli]|nr:Tn3 family transposase [Escherichia coli]